MLNAFFVVLAVLVTVAIAGRWYGASQWTTLTQAVRARLDAAPIPVAPRVVDFSGLEGLPAPVRRFFRAVLREGQSHVAGVHLQHAGMFNMGENTDQWKPFASDQAVVLQRPGFDWDGRIAMLPGLPVRVHDAYVAGEGILHASLLGSFALADMRGGGDIAQGELMRFFAEATWYPTALLPGQSVWWTAIDDRSALATMTDGPLSVVLRFTFHSEGPIDTVSAEGRGRMFGGTLVPTPWQGRFWNYADRSGMRVPLDGEVAWLLPTGAKPYWRGHMTDITFEFTR